MPGEYPDMAGTVPSEARPRFIKTRHKVAAAVMAVSGLAGIGVAAAESDDTESDSEVQPAALQTTAEDYSGDVGQVEKLDDVRILQVGNYLNLLAVKDYLTHAKNLSDFFIAVGVAQAAAASASSGGGGGGGGPVGSCGGSQYDYVLDDENREGDPNAWNLEGSDAWGCYQIRRPTWDDNCPDLGAHGSASAEAQADCADRLPANSWDASQR